VDTNVIVALWNSAAALSTDAQTALKTARSEGAMVISRPVFAELMASSGRTAEFVETFLLDASIETDWLISESIWRLAGAAFQRYAVRRRQHKTPLPRRFLRTSSSERTRLPQDVAF
jgi:predicted nucleic acid-binding protein